MELTWLADTPQSRRRTRALRACPSCQRRKKRCRHLGPDLPTSGQTLTAGIAEIPARAEKTSPSSRPSRPSSALDRLSRPTGSLPSSPGISRIERFVGDLNPEAAIREKVDAPNEAYLRDRVGLWINASAPQAHGHKGEGSPPFYTMPLVDHGSFVTDSAKGGTSVFLERAMCLVAAKDGAAAPYLRLVTEGALVAAREFCSEVYNGLVCAMDAGLEQDRIIRIRILALMSLHSEGYEGAEAASMHLCQAIHQSQTAGLHLERPNRSPGDSLTTLFWCMWTLDKMHASIGGRPVLLADRDIGIKRPDLTACHSKSAFDVWYALSELLSTVISFYRPSADDTTGWEMGYPSFEEIIGDHVQGDLDFAALGVLEVYYHAISILSCRYRPTQRPDGSKPSYTRQGLAAVRIYSLVATECAQSLPPLPVVPYAVALSMGVSYQQFRSSKLITYFDRARGSLEACCALLKELGTSWYSAEAMARLGRKALRQIDEAHFGDNQPSRGLLPSTTTTNISGSLEHNTSSAVTQGISGARTQLSSHSSDGHSLSGCNLAAAAVSEQSVLPPLSGQLDNPEDSLGGNGFADIDMLFDDFLDLSLPTNFWDPVFFPSEESQGF
ncbi:hypothetical protein BDV12DRAFT_182009 [Aspergillus spectabilis]